MPGTQNYNGNLKEILSIFNSHGRKFLKSQYKRDLEGQSDKTRK